MKNTKKISKFIIATVTVLMFALTLAIPAFAAENDTPSMAIEWADGFTINGMIKFIVSFIAGIVGLVAVIKGGVTISGSFGEDGQNDTNQRNKGIAMIVIGLLSAALIIAAVNMMIK